MFHHVSKASEASKRLFLFRLLILLFVLNLSVLLIVSFSPSIHVTAANVNQVISDQKDEVINTPSASSREAKDLFGTLFKLFTNSFASPRKDETSADKTKNQIQDTDKIGEKEKHSTTKSTSKLPKPKSVDASSHKTALLPVGPSNNETIQENKGIIDDVTDGISQLVGGGVTVDTGSESLGLVPNHCWYRGFKYECGLSLTCAMTGKKAMDLCNGGLIWTCCIDRDKIDVIDPKLGAISDAKCGEIRTKRYFCGHKVFWCFGFCNLSIF